MREKSAVVVTYHESGVLIARYTDANIVDSAQYANSDIVFNYDPDKRVVGAMLRPGRPWIENHNVSEVPADIAQAMVATLAGFKPFRKHQCDALKIGEEIMECVATPKHDGRCIFITEAAYGGGALRRESEASAPKAQAPGYPQVRVGSDVLFVLDAGPARGETRPAKVVRVWDGSVPTGERYPLVQLQVFTDGGNDGLRNDHHVIDQEHRAHNVLWRTSVHYSEAKAHGTWHWPLRF